LDNAGGAASRWYDAIVERIDFRDSWLSGRFHNFADWRSHARAVLIELFGTTPLPVPFDVETLDIQERATYSVRRLRFNVHAAFRTEAYILMPRGDGPFPGIVALHDHGGFFLWGKEKLVRTPIADHPAMVQHLRHYDGRFIADELAARGYAVIVIDAWHWGEQRVPDVMGAGDLDLSTAEGVAAYHRLFPDFERRTINALKALRPCSSCWTARISMIYGGRPTRRTPSWASCSTVRPPWLCREPGISNTCRTPLRS